MSVMQAVTMPATSASTVRVDPAASAARRPAGSSLRLTRRGRLVAVAAAALLVAALMLVAAGTAQATSHSAAQRNLAQVVVTPGESLWSVAESADPGQDTRLVIQQIIELNALNGYVIFPGQRLWVPRG